MLVADCHEWQHFLSVLSGLERVRDEQSAKSGHPVQLLFRGQADATWGLETTLDRYTAAPTSVAEYYRKIYDAKTQIESYTGRKWVLQSPDQLEAKRATLGEDADPWNIPAETYEFMVHLRHHGFPSPLLDWSKSPFVAAFFAFGSARVNVDRVVIYAYFDDPGKQKYQTLGMGLPIIGISDAHVSSHKRHFLQQSRYTICLQKQEDGTLMYGSHSSALSVDSINGDSSYRITLIGKMRIEVLSYLNRFNLNAYSLFGSEESLMETTAMNVFNFSD